MPRKTNFKVNGKEYYKVTRTIGHKADGTSIKKVFYGSGVNEANLKADEYVKKIKNGMSITDITIEELLSMWLFQVKRNELKPSSFQAYEITFRLLVKNSEIANIKVLNTKGIMLQEYYNKLR